ncbi:hypothetical protein [Rhodococcus aetherivorans]|uniref:hypothetical protein n=1 Tax=Rhodococcus aetherivorans TaxID=191292 RepID=UPI00365C3FEE
MPLPEIKFNYIGTIHSPFSGEAAETEDGPNDGDQTLLFVYYGDATVWDYISPRLADQLPDNAEDLEPDELVELIEIESGLVMVVDTDWNGVNYYGFAPTTSEQ